MSFVRDVTIGEGESVPPSTTFTKTWTVQNSGAEVIQKSRPKSYKIQNSLSVLSGNLEVVS